MRFQGADLATATGFVVESARGPVLVTNLHNLTGRHPRNGQPLSRSGQVPDEVVIVHNRTRRLGEWVSTVEPLFNADEPRWIKHPDLGDSVDIAALPLTQLTDVQIYPYDLDDTGPRILIGPADAVSVVGFPFGLRESGSLAIWATGYVASEPVIDFNKLPVFLVDCRSRAGQSGSAVIGHRSAGPVVIEGGTTVMLNGPVMRFLGIYGGKINDQSDLGIVWKAAAIRTLVESIR